MSRAVSLFFMFVISINSTAATAARPYAPDYTYERYKIDYVVRLDGTYDESLEQLIRIDTPNGADTWRTDSVIYVSSQDKITSIKAWTESPDGTRIEVPDTLIQTQETGDESQAKFSDRKKKAIVYPKVEVGSKVYLRYTMTRHTPDFPGAFYQWLSFSDEAPMLDIRVTVSLPKSMRLYVDNRGLAGGLVATGSDTDRYEFHHTIKRARAEEDGSIHWHDYSPTISFTTFSDMAALAKVYQEAFHAKVRVTDAVRNLALKETAELTNDPDRIKALYEWVATNIRYVSVSLGNGRLVPHSAEEVLANQYGDCKDHAVLFEALLTAVGIPSSPALVNYGRGYRIPVVGELAAFNHVITYLPTMDLYLDTTSRFTPFGTLPFGDMDKPTLLTALGRLVRTPRMLAEDHLSHTDITFRIRSDGIIDGQSSTYYTGVNEAESRRARFNDQISPEDQVVKELLYRFNETGTGSIDYSNPEDIGEPYKLDAKFELNPVSNFPGRGAMMVPTGLAPGGIANMASNAPLNRTRPYPCRSNTTEERYLIEFPENVGVDGIPQGMDYQKDGIDYRSSYSQKGREVVVTRRLVVQHPSNVCSPEDNEKWQAFHKILQRDVRAQIFYR